MRSRLPFPENATDTTGAKLPKPKKSYRLGRNVILFGLAAGAAFLPGCRKLAPPSIDSLPDLIVNGERLQTTIDFRTKRFPPTDCSVVEGCTTGSGERILLRFDMAAANIGEGDLFVGRPAENPELFEYSPCHGHYHFSGFAIYELLADDARTVVTGRKQGFCLVDSERFLRDAPNSRAYDCNFQGITAGWQDVYTKELECQWLDITGIRPGNYILRVTVNPNRRLAEINHSNNTATVSVTIR